MLKLLLIIFLSIVMNVQPQQSDDWYYEMGDDWDVSNKLAEVNPYYAWYQQAAAQMDTYGFAQHVGKIDRGQFFDPELNMPGDRAFGYQSDFNPEDFNSGAFNIKPQGQKYRAKAVHVNEGLASYVGEVLTMPIGQYVQEDGTILVQASYSRGDPCHPNPCSDVRMSTCTAVNMFTARCSRNEAYKLTLSWSDPYSDATPNNINLLLVADYHDGSSCAAIADDSSVDWLEYDVDDCGAILSADDYDDYSTGDSPNIAEESATLTTVTDGTNYKSYTYAVIAFVADGYYNPSEGRPTLTVEYNGSVKQTLAIPQYRAGGSNVNYMDTSSGAFRPFYFFGCFRPQLGYVDTRGAGFHDEVSISNIGTVDTVVTAGLGIFSPGLCKATLSWSSGYGFNPYEQSGSGDEAGSTYL